MISCSPVLATSVSFSNAPCTSETNSNHPALPEGSSLPVSQPAYHAEAAPPATAAAIVAGNGQGAKEEDIPAIPKPTRAAPTRRPSTPNRFSGSIADQVGTLTAGGGRITQTSRPRTPR